MDIYENLLYLVHTSGMKPDEIIDGELKTSKINKYQFPGVFFSLITKFNYNKENFYPNKYYYYFPIDLLNLNNYHFNIIDYNGGLSQFNTYYPFNLQEGLEVLFKNDNYMNEIVFHDNIKMKYCLDFFINNNEFPKKQLRMNIEPNILYIPFYAFSNEDIYNGIPLIKKSEYNWFQKLAILADINPNETQEEILIQLRMKMDFLYKNRHLQKLNEFKNLILYKNSSIS